jgi:hypothetical protein
MAKPTTKTEFLASLSQSQVALVRELRSAIQRAAPNATEIVKSGWLFFEQRGPICFIQPHSKHVNLGFWRGARLPDPSRSLEGTGKHMRHIKIRDLSDIDAQMIGALVRAGAKLNRDVPYTGGRSAAQQGAEADRQGPRSDRPR